MARGGSADCATKQGFLGPILPTNAPLSFWALLAGLSTRIGRQLAETGVDQEFLISIGFQAKHSSSKCYSGLVLINVLSSLGRIVISDK
jgi:hypothetical protein